MANPGDQFPPGQDWIPRRFRELQRQIDENASARSLAASQIGAGGLLINGGGSLTIAGTGSLNVGSGALNSAGSISAGTTITAGGAISAGTTITATGTISGGGFSTSGAIVGNTVSANGISTGSFSASGTSTLGPMNCAWARGHTVLSGYANAYWDGNGDAGVNVSSVIYKQDIAPADLSDEVQAILRMALVRFRYITAVEEYGEDAPVELGSLAEYVESIGLGEYVFYDLEGNVQGIAYERLTIPLIAVVQSLDARLKVLEAA